MYFITNLCLCVFSIALLLSVRLSERKEKGQDGLGGRLLRQMLYLTMLALVFDLFSRLEGRTGAVDFFLNEAGNLILFLLSPVLPMIWLLYAHNQIYAEDRRTLRFAKPFFALLILNAILTLLTQWFDLYYSIDAQNLYHRGPLFFLPTMMSLLALFFTFGLLLHNRKRIDRKYFFALMFFGVPPLITAFLQIFIYGIAFVLNGTALSLIIMYIITQNRRMHIDYLTGVFNRSQLDYYLDDQIRRSAGDKSFSAILLDLNDFKEINDRFGHNMGDDALKTVADLLKKSTRRGDFIARFGGDEFYVVTDLSHPGDLEALAGRIRANIEAFNARGEKPYKLSLGMGYLVYDCAKQKDAEEFKSFIDRLMYENKSQSKVAED